MSELGPACRQAGLGGFYRLIGQPIFLHNPINPINHGSDNLISDNLPQYHSRRRRNIQRMFHS